ncbi:hypothetical protein ACJJTC_005205 [Scirpophaga incertulas]
MSSASLLKEYSSLLSSFTHRESNEKIAEEAQNSLGLKELDPIAISLLHSKQVTQNLDLEYTILKLQHKNAQLQMEIDQNNKFLEDLKNDLISFRQSFMAQSVNPDNIHEHIRQLQLKAVTYKENCEKAKKKLTQLSIPDGALPTHLMALVSTLATLRQEAATLQQRADTLTLARTTRKAFKNLRI